MLLIEKIAEEKIQDAIKKGEFRDLPSKGKPYTFDGYLFENPNSRLELKILRDNNILPNVLEHRSEIYREMDLFDNLKTSFTPIYICKIEEIYEIAEVKPSYPISEYHNFLEKHKRFLVSYLPIIAMVKRCPTLHYKIKDLDFAIHRRRDRLEKIYQILYNLINKYNQELFFYTLKYKVNLCHFPTPGILSLKERMSEFDKLFIGAEL